MPRRRSFGSVPRSSVPETNERGEAEHENSCFQRKELCTRDELIEDLWTNGMYIDGNTLYVNIGRLHEKLGQLGANDFVRTVRGVGYRL